jgi:hypothetical protein
MKTYKHFLDFVEIIDIDLDLTTKLIDCEVVIDDIGIKIICLENNVKYLHKDIKQIININGLILVIERTV